MILVREGNKNDLFGVCSEVAEMFREKGLAVQVYPESLDDMDIFDRTNVNLIIFGNNPEGIFYRIIDNLINYGLRVVSQSNHRNLSRTESSCIEYSCLFEIAGKRIKIRDRTSIDSVPD